MQQAQGLNGICNIGYKYLNSHFNYNFHCNFNGNCNCNFYPFNIKFNV
jgi:hypothetical protein